MRWPWILAAAVVASGLGAVAWLSGTEGRGPTAACQGGDAKACLAAGEPTRAEALYREACERGEADGCSGLGDLYSGVLEGPLLAARRRACELGSGPACTKLAWLLREGDYPHRVNVDPSGAMTAYERACELADAKGCFGLGDALLRGVGPRVDRERAAAAFARACEGGLSDGCEAAKKLGAE